MRSLRTLAALAEGPVVGGSDAGLVDLGEVLGKPRFPLKGSFKRDVDL